jgi:hypothetical protein
LCRRFQKGIHVPVDDLRAFVVSGGVSPLTEWTAETARQSALSRKAASVLAAAYSEAGFAVVIDDVVREADMDQFSPAPSWSPNQKGRPHPESRDRPRAAAGDHVECLARRRRLHSRCGGGPALEVHALIGHGLGVIR